MSTTIQGIYLLINFPTTMVIIKVNTSLLDETNILQVAFTKKGFQATKLLLSHVLFERF